MTNSANNPSKTTVKANGIDIAYRFDGPEDGHVVVDGRVGADGGVGAGEQPAPKRGRPSL